MTSWKIKYNISLLKSDVLFKTVYRYNIRRTVVSNHSLNRGNFSTNIYDGVKHFVNKSSLVILFSLYKSNAWNIDNQTKVLHWTKVYAFFDNYNFYIKLFWVLIDLNDLSSTFLDRK